MSKRLPIAILVIALLLAGGWWVDRSRAAKESVLSGFFESQPTQASSRLGGRVKEILVKEGDQVHAGQPLVRLEDRSYAETVKAQESAAEQARQQLLETSHGARREDIEKQRAILNAAVSAYEKALRGPRPEEIRAAKAKFDQALAMYQRLVAGSRPEEVEAAQAASNVALEKLRQAERGLTQEEKNQLKARLDEAKASERLAAKNLARIQALFDQGVVSKQQLDQSVATEQEAAARSADAQAAYERGVEGTPSEELNQARQAYRQARAQLALVEHGNRPEDIRSARADMDAARQNWLLLQRGSRPEDIAAAKANVDQQSAALQELQAGNRREEVAKAQAAHQEAVAQSRSAQQNLNEQVVVSPFDGTVDRVLIADGDLVAPNGPVIQLVNPADIWLRVYLPEDQLPKISVGAAAELAVDGVAGTVLATVESIDSKGQFTPANLQSPEERAKQVFGVRLRLKQADSRIKAGMYASVKRMGSWP